MSFRNRIALSVTLLLCISATAHAGQYAATGLGKALPMWMETLADINGDGDVAWTEWNGNAGASMPAGTHNAKIYTDGAFTATELDSDRASSWAVGITPRVSDGNTIKVVGIAGSDADNPRMTDRRALLWSVRVNSTPEDSKVVPLNIEMNLEGGATKVPQQSAAYGIVERSGANQYYVGGFARERVASSVLPRPVIWTVTNAHDSPEINAHALASLGGALGNGNGYVSSIAKNDETGTIWACGNSSGATGVYVQATCWNITSGPSDDLAADATITNALTTAYGAGNVATSMVNRVRTVPVGPNGEIRTVAVGSALVKTNPTDPNSTAATWKGWLYDLDANTLWEDLNLTDENETLAYDVASLSYVGNNGGADITSKGMVVAGISSTATPAEVGGLEGGPVAPAATMTGVERRMLTSGITDDGQVCAINDDSTEKGGYDQLLALSGDATYRLAMADGNLYRLNIVPQSATLTVLQRTTSSRTNTRPFGASRATAQHQQARAILGAGTASSALLRFGQSLACQALEDVPALTACTGVPAAFDIQNTQSVALNPDGGASSDTLISDKIPGTSIDSSLHYAQLALQDESNNCTITPVLSATEVTLDERVGQSNNEKDNDYDGDEWTWCGGDNWVDVTNDVNHCNTCNTDVQTLACADTVCTGGTPAIDTVDGGKCAMGPENQWACYDEGDAQIIDGTVNPCRRCQPPAQTAWSEGDPFDTAYRCVAHHDSTPYGGCGDKAFYRGSECSTNNEHPNGGGTADFGTHAYTTKHLCARRIGDVSAGTTDVQHSSIYWEKIPQGLDSIPEWPLGFSTMTPIDGDQNIFFQSSEVRKWIFKYPFRYLGQMNNLAEGSAGGLGFHFGKEPTNLYLEPGQEEWLVFHYSDEKNWQDRIGVLAQFDDDRLDIELETYFVCAHTGANGRPRLDGFRYCGAEGNNRAGQASASDMGVECGDVGFYEGTNIYTRYSSCKGDTAVEASSLPWKWVENSQPHSFGENVSSTWGSDQKGIYVEGHIDCGDSPSSNSSRRRGWAFIRVKRKNTVGKDDPTVCTPITIRATWFHHGTNASRYQICWSNP